MSTENQAKTTSKINKDDIKGLPDKAAIQTVRGKTYVFFAYCYNLDGKRFQERDYIGTVNANLEFVPNDYYIDHQPVRDKRPLRNWTNPKKAEIERAKAEAANASRSSRKSQPAETEPFERSAGATAVAVKILQETGLAKDVLDVLDGNAAEAIACLNIGMHAALTGRPTYLASEESYVQKFIGSGCPDSQRASELHARLGRRDSLDMAIAKKRCARLGEDELLALDGTRLDCESDNIELSAQGKRKNGTYGRQINFSVLFNATRGEALSYRAYAGNFNDVCTLDDFRSIWREHGIAEKSPRLILDRGYFSQDQLVRLDRDGFKFLVGAKTTLNCVKDVIEGRNHEFYEMDALIRGRPFYGVHEDCLLRTASGTASVRFHVYRNPNSEMAETEALLDELDQLESCWDNGSELTDRQKALLEAFYIAPTAGKPLARSKAAVREHCYTLGFFAMAGNEKRSCKQALDDYDYRNEVEVFFREHMGRQRTTRVHSMETLAGSLFTTFIGTSVVTNLLHRMRERVGVSGALRMNYSVPLLVKTLQKVHLIKAADGSVRLTNVTSRERDIVERLGFPGLFDSAEALDKLLSASGVFE